MNRFSRFPSIFALGAISLFACSSKDHAKPAPPRRQLPPSQASASVASHTAVVPESVRPEPAPLIAPTEESTEAKPAFEEKPEPVTYSEYMQRAQKRLATDPEGAIADFTAAVEKRPDDENARLKLARALLSVDRATEAREHIELAVELNPESSLGWNTLGRVDLARGDLDSAAISFARAAEENENNSYAWNNLGFVRIEQGQFSEAVDALERATSGTQPTPYMWNNLGMAYEHLDRIVEARAAYRQGLMEGSDKAQANFDRLVGVKSLRPDSEDEVVADLDATEGREFEASDAVVAVE